MNGHVSVLASNTCGRDGFFESIEVYTCKKNFCAQDYKNCTLLWYSWAFLCNALSFSQISTSCQPRINNCNMPSKFWLPCKRIRSCVMCLASSIIMSVYYVYVCLFRALLLVTIIKACPLPGLIILVLPKILLVSRFPWTESYSLVF